MKVGRKWHGACRTALLLHSGRCAETPGKDAAAAPLAASTRSVAPLSSPLVRNFLVGTSFAPKVMLMRYRAGVASITSAKIGQERRKVRRRTLALIIVIACVPVMGTVLAVVSTTEPDLSDLVPSNKQIGDYVILDWRDFARCIPIR